MFTFPNNYFGIFDQRFNSFLFGGRSDVSSNSGITNTIKKYDGLSVSTESSTLSVPLHSASAAAFDSSNMYIFGGFTTTASGTYTLHSLDTIQKYTGTVRSTSSAVLKSKLKSTSASLLGSNIFVFGGRIDIASSDGGTQSGYYDYIQRFSGTAMTTDTSSLANGKSSTSSVTIASKIYIFGGHNSSVSSYSTIENYDGANRNIEGVTLEEAVHSTSCSTIGTNAYIFGGVIGSSWSVSTSRNTIQKFDGISRTTIGTTLQSATFDSSASTSGSSIRIFGGFNSSNSIKRFDGLVATVDNITISSTISTTAIGFGIL